MTDQSDAELIARLREFEGSDELGNGDFSLIERAADRLEVLTRSVEPTEAMLDAAEEAYDAVSPAVDAHRYGLKKAYLAMQSLSVEPTEAIEALKLALDWVEGYEPYDTRESKQKERDLKKIRAVLQSLSHKETMG